MNPIQELHALGQSIWLDFIRRRMLDDGELQRLVAEGVRGVTSNPAIFRKAIAEGNEYAAAFAALRGRNGLTPEAAFEAIALGDIRHAADILRPVYDASAGKDGYVSFEVSPRLAHDTGQTVADARRLWRAVDRPNAMIKVPATAAGLPAVETLIAEGINVNVTLLFARGTYARCAEAFLSGLETRAAGGGDIARVASVASVFVSRIDSAVDKELDARGGPDAAAVRGKIAIANAKLAYAHYKDRIASTRWRDLAARGALPQRLLWASTGTKDPAYSDVLYLETLIGTDTVNTVPPKTLAGFRDHGTVAATLEDDLDGARAAIAALEALGISLDAVTDALLTDGVGLFADAFDGLLATVEQELTAAA